MSDDPQKKGPGKTGKRDMSRAAALRKARSRARVRADGFETVTIELSREVMAELRATSKMTGGSVKDHAQFLVRVTAARHRQETTALRDEARRLNAFLEEIQPFIQGVREPGQSVEIKGRVVRYEDWKPVADKLREIQMRLARRGWSRSRIELFCKSEETSHLSKRQGS